MNEGGMVAVVTDGEAYWTELYLGDSPQGTFQRRIDQKRWPSMFAAKEGSPWWPAGEPGSSPAPDDERMHRATCSWSQCEHRVLWIAEVPARS